MRRTPVAATATALPALAVAATACAALALAVSRSASLLLVSVVLVTAVVVVQRCPVERFVGLAGCVVVAAMVLIPVQRTAALGSKLPLLTTAGLLAVAVVLVVLRGQRIPAFWSRSPGLLVAFVVLSFLTTWPGDDATWRWVALLFACLLCGFVVGVLAHERERRALVATTIGLALLQAAYAVYEMLARPVTLWTAAGRRSDGTDVVLPNELLGAGVGRAQAAMGHPLPLVLLLLIAIGLVLRLGPRLGRLPRVLAIAVLLAGIVAAGSRSGAVIATGIIIFTGPKRAWTGVVTGAYVGGLLVAVLSEVGFFASSTVNTFLSGGSLHHRLGALDAVSRLIAGSSTRQVLFGHGYDSVAKLFASGMLQTDGFKTIDNQFVTTFAKTGLVGLLLLLAAVTRSLVDGARRWGPALVVTVAMFLSFEVLEWASSALLMGLLMGLATADGRSSAPSAAPALGATRGSGDPAHHDHRELQEVP